MDGAGLAQPGFELFHRRFRGIRQLLGEGGAKIAQRVPPGGGQGIAVRRQPAGAALAGLRQLFAQIANILAADGAGKAGDRRRADAGAGGQFVDRSAGGKA